MARMHFPKVLTINRKHQNQVPLPRGGGVRGGVLFPLRLLTFWLLFFAIFRLWFVLWFHAEWSPEAPTSVLGSLLVRTTA